MKSLEQVVNAIEQDPQNQQYTQAGISPLIQVMPTATILLISQAPSRRAQEAGIMWHDPSGVRLREWLGVTDAEFYQAGRIAVLPMDFYFPGKGKSGDLPPRPGFADKWQPPLMALMPHIQLTLLVGQYAQRAYLGKRRQSTLTATVQHFRDYLPTYFPLVHPSPLNYGWLHKNPWFEETVLPELRTRVRRLLN